LARAALSRPEATHWLREQVPTSAPGWHVDDLRLVSYEQAQLFQANVPAGDRPDVARLIDDWLTRYPGARRTPASPHRGTIPPALEATLSGTAVGGRTAPIRVDGTWHVYLVREVLPESALPEGLHRQARLAMPSVAREDVRAGWSGGISSGDFAWAAY